MCVSCIVVVYLKGLKATFYVLILVYINYTLGVFEGHFEFFSVSSGAFVNFIQWQSCFWHFCGCQFGCFKNDNFSALLQLCTS